MIVRQKAKGKRQKLWRFFSDASCPMPNAYRAQRGFTLVEMIVAVALFAVIMLVSVGALLSLVGANRKAQALQSVMNNLNMALDGMVRSIRMGTSYRCASSAPLDPNCANGGQSFFFEPYGGNPDNPSDDWSYFFDSNTHRLYKSENNGVNYFGLTAPEVTIDSMTFYVIGARRGTQDPQNVQPKIVITVKGTAGVLNAKTRSTFNIQATAVQRVLDL